MMIETRSPAGYVVICKRHDDEHRFLAKHPGLDLTCPRCGNTAKSMALLLDYIGAAPPWRQINAPARRRIAAAADQPPEPPQWVHQGIGFFEIDGAKVVQAIGYAHGSAGPARRLRRPTAHAWPARCIVLPIETPTSFLCGSIDPDKPK